MSKWSGSTAVTTAILGANFKKLLSYSSASTTTTFFSWLQNQANHHLVASQARQSQSLRWLKCQDWAMSSSQPFCQFFSFLASISCSQACFPSSKISNFCHESLCHSSWTSGTVPCVPRAWSRTRSRAKDPASSSGFSRLMTRGSSCVPP